MMKVSLTEGVLVESLGSNLVVMIPRSQIAITVGGSAATLLESLTVAERVEVEHSDALAELVALGIAEVDTDSAGLSRRSLLVAGSGVAGAGVLALALPTVAMASSVVRSVKGIIFNSGGKVAFWVTEEYVAVGDVPSDWWPDPAPSSDLSTVSALTVNGASIPVDAESSNLGAGESNSIQWLSTIDYAGASSSYSGTFRWAGHDFLVTFQQLNG